MKTHFRLAAAIALLTALAGAAFGLAPQDIQETKLDNGLKVLLLPRHGIPSVAFYTFFRVGSRNERVGITGVSHFIEHMMFNGSKSVPPGEFDRIMEGLGGSNNAYTGNDMTAYTDWFPPDAMEAMVKQEADRMQGLLFAPEVFESERGVIASERRRTTESDNMATLGEQLNATAIMAHPYHWGVIGWMSDILNWKRDDVVAYYKTYYAPNNAVLIVVGDFEPAPTLELIRKHFGPLASQTPPPPVTTVEPEQNGTKRVSINKEAQAPLLALAFHGAACQAPDNSALEALETILLGGESSRLYKRLVRKEQTVLGIGGGNSETIDPNLFQVFVQPKPGANLTTIENQILEEIELVRQKGVTEQEVRKAVNKARFKLFAGLQTNGGIANGLGKAEVLYGDWKSMFTQAERFEKLTPEDVRKAAQTYLTTDNMTVGTLVPREENR